MNSSIGSTDTKLISRAQRREAEAWDQLVDLYGPWIYNWTRRMGLSAEDGADSTQETLLAVHRTIGRFSLEGSGASFRGWMWTVLRSKVFDQRRRRGAENAVRDARRANTALTEIPEQLPDESSDPAARSEHELLVQRAMMQVQQEFEPQTWQAFWRVVVDGRTPMEVAAEMGMTAVAVRKAKSRVLRRLKDQLGEGDGTRS